MLTGSMASVCEDYSAIRCPVYAVGGWTDGYSDAVLRLMANLTVPRKALDRSVDPRLSDLGYSRTRSGLFAGVSALVEAMVGR